MYNKKVLIEAVRNLSKTKNSTNTNNGLDNNFKRGGSNKRPSLPKGKSPKSYSRSFEATNRLFAENPLFKKPKSRKNKIFDPRAQYYEDGGLTQYEPGGYSDEPPGSKKKNYGDSKRILPRWMPKGMVKAIQNTEVGISPYMTNEQAYPIGMKQNLTDFASGKSLLGEGTKAIGISNPSYGVNFTTGLTRDISKNKDSGWALKGYLGKPYDPSMGQAVGQAIQKMGKDQYEGAWERYYDDLATYNAGEMSGSAYMEGPDKWDPEKEKPKESVGKFLKGFGKAVEKSPVVGGLSAHYRYDKFKQPHGYKAAGEGEIKLDWDPSNNIGLGLKGGLEFYGGDKYHSKNYRPGSYKWNVNPSVTAGIGTRPHFGFNLNAGVEGLPKFMPKNFPGYFYGNVNYNQSLMLPGSFSANAGMKFPLNQYKQKKAQKEINEKIKNDPFIPSNNNVKTTTFGSQNKNGGISINLTEDEIQKYVDGGYIVEDDISVPELNQYAPGGAVKPMIDENGEPRCPDGYTYNPETGWCEGYGDKCPDGYVKDPETGKCKSVGYKVIPGVLDENKKVIDRSKLERKYTDWPEDLNLTQTDFDDTYGDVYIQPAGSYTIYSDNKDYLTTIPFYPDLNYKVEVDANKPEGFDKSTNTYYVKSKDTHQYEKYRQWQILKEEEKQNLDKIQKAGLKTKIGETILYDPNNEYKFSHYNSDLNNEPDNESTRRYKQQRDAFKQLYEDPEYIPDVIKNQSYNDYQKKRKQGNIESEQCPECSLYHGSTYDISDDYVRENINLSKVTKEYPDVIFKKDEDGYEDAQNIDWEKQYTYADPSLDRKIPTYETPELELEGFGIPRYEFPEGKSHPKRKNTYKLFLNQRYDTQPLIRKSSKIVNKKENPLLRFITGYDREKGTPELYKSRKSWNERYIDATNKMHQDLDNAENVKFPSFRGVPIASWDDYRARREYKKDWKNYVKNELPALRERNRVAKEEYNTQLEELMQRKAYDEKLRQESTLVSDKYGGQLDSYAPGGWPPKGLRKSRKPPIPNEPKTNKITITNPKDPATNLSAAQTIKAVKDRTVNLWNSAEGQRRLQNVIDTTPALKANLFFDSKDMVSDLANTRNLNQEAIAYRKTLNDIIGEQNKIDSYYDQNLMSDNDYFNTSVSLDNQLKTAEENYAKLLQDSNTQGGAFYDRNENAFVINPKFFTNEELPSVGMHEIIHLPGLKRGTGLTSLDVKLGGLDLKNQLDFDLSNTSNNNIFYKHLNKDGNYLQNAISYYNLNGGFERSPFLAELRENMLQNNIIKHPYQKVNSKMIKDYYKDYLKKEDKFPLRIFDIMTNKPKNFSLLSNTMNELPSWAPYAIGAGTTTLLSNPFDAQNNLEDNKYNDGGEPCPEGYIRNTNTGKCVLDVSAEQIPAEEWYKNWYANRVIQDEEGQKLLNEARPKLLKRTEKFPEIEYDTEGLDDSSGMYNPMTGKISLNSSQVTSPFIRDEVLFHERGHYLTSPSKLDPEMDTYKKMKNHPIHKLREYETGFVNQALVPKNKVSKEEGKFYDYISGNYGEEMSKRIMELRRLAGFKPDQVITDDDLKNFYQKAKTKGWTNPDSDAFVPALIDFQRFINSPQDLKMLLNKMAKNEPEQVDEFQPQQAQYGGTPDYQLGDKVDKATMEKLKKLGYTFEEIK